MTDLDHATARIIAGTNARLGVSLAKPDLPARPARPALPPFTLADVARVFARRRAARS